MALLLLLRLLLPPMLVERFDAKVFATAAFKSKSSKLLPAALEDDLILDFDLLTDRCFVDSLLSSRDEDLTFDLDLEGFLLLGCESRPCRSFTSLTKDDVELTIDSLSVDLRRDLCFVLEEDNSFETEDVTVEELLSTELESLLLLPSTKLPFDNFRSRCNSLFRRFPFPGSGLDGLLDRRDGMLV